MFPNILNEAQQKLLPLLKNLSKEYCLVGNTAVSLQIGHKRSPDFDLFTFGKVERSKVKSIIEKNELSVDKYFYEDIDEVHLILNQVKLTLSKCYYKFPANINFNDTIQMPNLLDLAAIKACSLGKGAKWKDYVDLYFLFKEYFTLQQITQRASEIFKGAFNSRLFREQLSYYKKMDYSEEVVYMPDFKVSKKEIKSFLTNISTSEIKK